MKKAFATVSMLVIVFAVLAGAEAPSISVSIVVPRDGSHGERRVSSRNSGTEWDRAAHFFVVVSNVSEKPIKIWQEWCSWGYFVLSFEFTDGSGKKWVAKKESKVWPMNRPAFWVLEPDESLVYEIPFADPDIWKDFPKPDGGSKSIVSVRAVFEIASTPESMKKGVWTGRAVSPPRQLTFYHPK